MLNSLRIKNYRNLKDFKIESLDRVNLITGKNNTGKSTILEAIAIYAAKGDFTQIYDLLNERGEYYKPSSTSKDYTEFNIKTLSSLFTDRIIGYNKENYISIGIIDRTLFGDEESPEKSITFRFVRYIEEIQTDKQGELTTRKRTILEEDIDQYFVDYKVGIEVKLGSNSNVFALGLNRRFGISFTGISNAENLQFIRTRNIDKVVNGKLWDNIILTEKEYFVIEALRIVEPETERIAFIEENSNERRAVVKLSNNPNVLPLRSMGDGINRILTIILALVNADNGFLLIDEFENGLHYTVQQKLWEIIFTLSKKLNVQVFVTTHSEDCIAGFEDILNSDGNSSEGKLIRLDNVNGTIKQVEYDAHELRIATEQNIETR